MDKKQFFEQELEKCIKLMNNTVDPELKLGYQKEAGMWADRLLELDKIESNHKNDKIDTYVEVGKKVVDIALKVGGWCFIVWWGKRCANFELTNTWTTSPGKGIANPRMFQPEI